MKISTLNKITAVFFFHVFLCLTIIPEDSKFIDTINIRKAFFNYESDWDKFTNKATTYQDRGINIALICKLDKENYELLFFPAYKGLKNFNVYGRILYQFNKDKELLKARIYFHEEDNSYCLFLKNKPGKFDVYLFDKLFIKDLPYYFPFDSLKVVSLNSIIELLKTNKLSDKLLIESSDKLLKQNLADKIIIKSMTKKYIDDGARDEFGDYVYISSGQKQKENEGGYNCSGFLKEIADNYIRLCNPDFGYLSINELKTARSDIRKHSDFQYERLTDDPFFGLDWALNITDKINSNCNYDITKAAEYINDDYFEYKPNQGYNVTDLKEIIFRDQLKDNSYFYVLIFNKLREISPKIPFYYHISIIVPFFDSHHFNIRVFESNDETNFNSLLKLHSNEKVNIIKIPVPLVNL